MFIHKFCASWCFTKSYKGNAHNLERRKQKINQIGITTWSIHVNFILIYVIYSMIILISDMGLEMNERKEKQYILASGGLLSILCPIKSKWWSNDSVQSISIALRLWSNMAKKEQISHILVSTAVGILSNFLYLTACMSSTVVLLVKTHFTVCCTRITLHLTKTLESWIFNHKKRIRRRG